jgi:hypothetical protein
VKVAPPSTLSSVVTPFTGLLRYDRNRLPNVSHANVGSQQASGPCPASPSAMVRSVASVNIHVAPPSVLLAANRPAVAVLHDVKTWFGLAGFFAIAHS